MEENYLPLRGPVDREGDKLVLRIPLSAGGEQLSIVARGISEIEGEDLVVTIPHWLAQKIGISEGTEIYVDDLGGKFNITKAEVQ